MITSLVSASAWPPDYEPRISLEFEARNKTHNDYSCHLSGVVSGVGCSKLEHCLSPKVISTKVKLSPRLEFEARNEKDLANLRAHTQAHTVCCP